MSTVKVNEVRHLSNSGTANVVFESNGDTNLQTTSTLGLGVTGTLTVTGAATLTGSVQIGDAVGDTMTLTSTVSGFNNFSGFTGEVRMYAGTSSTAPSGWLYCNGNTIGQSSGNHTGASLQNLFILLSASALWGNSGSEAWLSATVNLPDFRSRAPVGAGTGALTTIESGTDSVALTARTLGATSGSENHALTIAQLAAHSHPTTSADNSAASVTGQAVTYTRPTATAVQAQHRHAISSTDFAHTHTLNHTHGTAAATSGPTTPVAGGGPSNNTTSTHSGHSHGISGVTAYNGTTGVGAPKRTLVEYGTAYANTSTDLSGSHSHNMSSHTHTGASHTHTTPATSTNAQTGNETHAQSGSGNTDYHTATGSDITVTVAGGNATITNPTHKHTITTTNTGSGTAHTILSPIIAVNYIIKI